MRTPFSVQKVGCKGEVGVDAGPAVADVHALEEIHRVEHADLAVVDDVVVADVDHIDPGVLDADDVLGTAAEDDALGGMGRPAIGVGALEVADVDVGSIAEDGSGRGEERLDPELLDEATRGFVGPAGEDIARRS